MNRRKPLFPQYEAPAYDPSGITIYDENCAKALQYVVTKHRKSMRPISIKVWSRHFSKLRQLDGVKKKRSKRVLVWYLQHFNQPYIPQAYSASGFRSKFLAIEAAMLRMTKDDIVISDEAKQIVDILKNLKWPKGSAIQLPLCVQSSLDSYADLLKKRHDTIGHIAFGHMKLPKSDMRKFIGFNTELDHRLQSAKGFVLDWMRRVNAQLNGWDDWAGELKSFAFRMDAKAFNRMGRTWAQNYCGDADRWDFYIKCLNENSET